MGYCIWEEGREEGKKIEGLTGYDDMDTRLQYDEDEDDDEDENEDEEMEWSNVHGAYRLSYCTLERWNGRRGRVLGELSVL